MTSIFLGGAVGSLIASSLYEFGGWESIALVAVAMPLIALIGFVYSAKKEKQKAHTA
jgi:predicted MFS family arabinose efflux permease